MCGVGGHLAREQVTGDDSAGPTVLEHDVEEFGPVVELDGTRSDLSHQGRVGTQQELLAGLAACVEGA